MDVTAAGVVRRRRLAALIPGRRGGTRFGDERKLLAEVGGRPVLERAVAAASAPSPAWSGCVVVLGARSAEVRARRGLRPGRDHGLPGLGDGPGGVAALRPARRCGGADEGGRDPRATRRWSRAAVIERFLDEPGRTRAVYGGRPGHPVVLGPEEIAAALGAVRRPRRPGSAARRPGDRGRAPMLRPRRRHP